MRYYLIWIWGILRAIYHSPSFLKALLKASWVDKETALTRLRICHSCDKLNIITRQCNICACFISIKVQWNLEHCPLKKW